MLSAETNPQVRDCTNIHIIDVNFKCIPFGDVRILKRIFKMCEAIISNNNRGKHELLKMISL